MITPTSIASAERFGSPAVFEPVESWLEVGEATEKSLGDKDLVTFRFADWLAADDEQIGAAWAFAEPGVTSLAVTSSQIAADGKSVDVAYEVVDRRAAVARILVTARSSNPRRVAANRAIPIHIH